MNRKQFQLFAGKLHKLAYQLEQDAKRLNVSSHPGDEFADRLRNVASEIRSIAQAIESAFG